MGFEGWSQMPVFVRTILVMATLVMGCSSSSAPAGSGADGSVGTDGSTGPDDAGSAQGEAEAATPTTCSPSTLLDPRPWETCPGDGYCECYGYAPDGGGLAFDSAVTIMNITSMALPAPMTANQPYSLSVSVSNSGFYGDIEFWGAMSECGAGLQKLYSAPVESKVYCADVLPTQSYTYILYVQRLSTDSGAPAGEHADTILACPTGRCPPGK